MTQVAQDTALTAWTVEHALGLTYEDIPTAAIERTKDLFLDFLGVALGGKALAESSPAMLSAVRHLAAGSRGDGTVVGEQERYPQHLAALLNAAFAHSLDFDDTHGVAIIHQGAPLFAALLAAAETAGRSGRDLLTAAVAGFDVGGRLGRVHLDGVHRRGFHPTATTGIFATTAAVGRLLGVDRTTLRHALGLDLSLAAGTGQFFETGGWNKPFQVGMTAQHALYSLVFAQAGYQGTGKPLEGRYGYFATYATPDADLSRALAAPPYGFEVLHAALKPYPCCRFSHATIDGVTAIARREDVQPEEVQRIEVFLPATNYQMVAEPEDRKRAPEQIVDGQFSIYFAAATAVIAREYTWDSYRRLQDPQVRQMMQRVTAHASPEVSEMGARVVVATRRGIWTEAVPLPSGEPENPLSRAEVERKFRALAAGTLGSEQMERVVQLVARLERLEHLADLTAALRSS